MPTTTTKKAVQPSFAESQPARAFVARPVVVTSNISAPDTDQQQSDDVQYNDLYQTFLSQQGIASQTHPASSSSDTGTAIKPGSSASHPQVARRSVNKQLRTRKHHRHGQRTQSRSRGRGGLHSYNAQLRAYQIRLQQRQQRKEQMRTGTRSPQQRYYGNRAGYILPSADLPSSSVGAAVPVRTAQANRPSTSQVAQPRRPVVAPYPIHDRTENSAMSQGDVSNTGQPGVTYDVPSGPKLVYATPPSKQPLQLQADPYQQHMAVQPLRAAATVYNWQHVALPGDRQNQASLWTPSDYSWKISGFTKCSHTCGGGKHANSFK